MLYLHLLVDPYQARHSLVLSTLTVAVGFGMRTRTGNSGLENCSRSSQLLLGRVSSSDQLRATFPCFQVPLGRTLALMLATVAVPEIEVLSHHMGGWVLDLVETQRVFERDSAGA